MQRQAVGPGISKSSTSSLTFTKKTEDLDLDRTLQKASPAEKQVPSVDVIWDTLNEQGSELSRLKTDHKTLQKEADRLRSKLRVANDEAEALRSCLDSSGVLSRDVLEEKVKETVNNSRQARQELREKERSKQGSLPAGDQNGRSDPVVEARSSKASAAMSPSRQVSSQSSLPPADLDATRLLTTPTPSAAKSKGRGKSAGRSKKKDDAVVPEARNWKSPLGPPREAEEDNDRSAQDSIFSFSRKPLVENDLYKLARPFLRVEKKDKDRPPIKGEVRAQAYYAFEECLRRGISPSKWDGPSTPLTSMVKSCEIEMVDLLIRARASPDEVDEKGVANLHTLAFTGYAPMMKCLLDGKANPDVADKHGQTPLFFAPKPGICSLLHTYRADPTVMNVKGQSALHLAARAGNESVLRWLIQHVSREVLELKDKHGATATYYARQAGVKHSVIASIYFHKPDEKNSHAEMKGRDLVKHPHRVGEDQIGAGPPGGQHKGHPVSHFVEKPKIVWNFADIHRDDGPKPRPPPIRRNGGNSSLRKTDRAKSTGALSARSAPEFGRTLKPEELDQYMRDVQEEEAAKVIQGSWRRKNKGRRLGNIKGQQKKVLDKHRHQLVEDLTKRKKELEIQMGELERKRAKLTQPVSNKGGRKLMEQLDGSEQAARSRELNTVEKQLQKMKAEVDLIDRQAEDVKRKKATVASPPSSPRGRLPSAGSPRNQTMRSPRSQAQQNKSAYGGTSYAERKRRLDEEERDRAGVFPVNPEIKQDKPASDNEAFDGQQRAAAEIIQQKYRRSVVIRNLQAAPTDGTWALCKALRNQQAVRDYKEMKVAKEKAKEDNIKDTYHGDIALKILKLEDKEGNAAAKIQARFRGNAVRKQAKAKAAEKSKKDHSRVTLSDTQSITQLHEDVLQFRSSILQEKDQAAITIQAHIRGHQARQKQAEEAVGLAFEGLGDFGDLGDLGGLDLDMEQLPEEEEENAEEDQAEDEDGEAEEENGEEAEEEQGEEAEEEEGDEFDADDDEEEDAEGF